MQMDTALTAEENLLEGELAFVNSPIVLHCFFFNNWTTEENIVYSESVGLLKQPVKLF